MNQIKVIFTTSTMLTEVSLLIKKSLLTLTFSSSSAISFFDFQNVKILLHCQVANLSTMLFLKQVKKLFDYAYF